MKTNLGTKNSNDCNSKTVIGTKMGVKLDKIQQGVLSASPAPLINLSIFKFFIR